MLKKSLSIITIIVVLIIANSIGLLAISPSDINEDLKVEIRGKIKEYGCS